jgi:hypothetical protein
MSCTMVPHYQKNLRKYRSKNQNKKSVQRKQQGKGGGVALPVILSAYPATVGRGEAEESWKGDKDSR